MGILLPLCYYQHSAGGTTNIAAVTINIPVMLVVNVASCPVMLVVRGASRKPVFPLFPPTPSLSATNAENQQIAKQTPSFTPKNVKSVFLFYLR